jgi:Zn-dependent protease with chaperone function
MSREDAEIRGYRPGGFCFNKVVYLPDLAIEKEIEIHWLAHLREHALFMDDPRRQATVNRLGRQILDNWPFELLGYNYSFHVINSGRITTMALPTGRIFITTALMDALESEDEIEALLVRAIAHIENRHSLKQYYLKSNAMKSKQFLQKLTMATGAFTGIIAGPGAGAIEALGNIPFEVSSNDQPLNSVFENDFERDADMVASLYFDLRGKDKRHLSAVIRKQQLAALYFNVRQKENFDLNAAMNNLELNEMAKQLYRGVADKKGDNRFNERAKRVENIEFRYFNDDGSFVLRKGRRFPVQLDLKYQSIFKNENKLMVYINDRSLFDNHDDDHNKSKVALLIHDRHGKHRFKLLSRYTTTDMWGVRITFEAEGKQPCRFLEDIQKVKIEVVGPRDPADKRNDSEIEHFAFVKGRLESETRVAQRLQPDS